MFDTIAAISSGNVNQPISIIRTSGSDAFAIVKKLFTGPVGQNRTITYGYIHENNLKVDEVLISWFKAPNTYTGEDIVEINAHGGVINTQHILELLLANGARIAERGEFSRRGFLNGKMNLVKAEAIHDLIMAQSLVQTNLAIKQFDGTTTQMILDLQQKLLKIIAVCEINIDYPEYDDVEVMTRETLLPQLDLVATEIAAIIETSKRARLLYEGIRVAIIGQPNVGKSSLLNALLQEDKAIVTATPGTTRDIVEGTKQVGDLLLKFQDTAGIHVTNDQIEQIGIAKALVALQNSDLVLHLLDASQPKKVNKQLFADHLQNKTYLRVYNKSDIAKAVPDAINISAKNGDLEQLYTAIQKVYKQLNLNQAQIIYNTRQIALIKASYIAIKTAIQALHDGFLPDTVIIDIQSAWNDLANILGQANHEDLLDSMFKNFCLGK